MVYAVADINVALDSVSQMCDGGATILFRKDGGTITDAGGTAHEFVRVGNTYKRRVWVPRDGSVFQGQKPTAS